jgi:vacuolar-type H+-ATPase subunit D/Vma8
MSEPVTLTRADLERLKFKAEEAATEQRYLQIAADRLLALIALAEQAETARRETWNAAIQIVSRHHALGYSVAGPWLTSAVTALEAARDRQEPA